MAVDAHVFRSELHPDVRFEVSHDLETDRWSVAWHLDDDPAAGSTVDDSEALFPRGPHTHLALYEWAVEHWETRAATAANELDSALDTNATSPDFFDAL